MTTIQETPSSALLEESLCIKIENSCSISEEDEDNMYLCDSMSHLSHQSEEGHLIYDHPSENLFLDQVVGKLERQDSCMSVGSLESSDDSHSSVGGEYHHEESSSDDGHDDILKRDSSERGGRSSSVVSDTSEGGPDSGIEAEKEPDMTVPDICLVEKIIAQVEFYFSDANVVKDKFLLKHIRRNKEGYVSLKLVSSFKKVKQLTKDWRVVAYSLEKASNLIQINDQRTKIRRVNPLPEIDDSPVTCAVLALDLPLEKPSVESVSKLFGSTGEIAFIRVLRAGGVLPPDVKSLLTKYPVLGEKHCAWIEFETSEAAKAATAISEENGMKVVLIVPESQKKQEKQQKQMSSSRKSSSSSKSSTSSSKNSIGSNYSRSPNSRKNSYNTNYNNFHNKIPKDSTQGHEARRLVQRRKAVSLPSSQNPFVNELLLKQEARKVRPKSKSCTEFNPSTSPPSWVQRHLIAAAAASAASAASPTGSRTPNNRISRFSLGSLPLSEGIVRFPKGPDGTKGFGRDSRLCQINETTCA